MFNGKRIICVSPVSKRRYMEVMTEHVFKHRGIVDEFHFWFNTKDPVEGAYIKSFAEQHKDFIKLIEGNPQYVGRIDNTRFFYKNCTEANTIYFKIDDDIMFMEKNIFQTLATFIMKNPHYFLVFPLIINNSWCSYFLKEKGVISGESTFSKWPEVFGNVKERMKIKKPEPRLHEFIDPKYILCDHFWNKGHVAYELQNNFLNDLLNNNIEKYRIGNIELKNYESCSIGFICWQGETFNEFGGNVDSFEDESWLTTFYPLYSGKINCICSDAIVVHHSYYIQRDYLDKTDILQKYKNLCMIY